MASLPTLRLEGPRAQKQVLLADTLGAGTHVTLRERDANFFPVESLLDGFELGRAWLCRSSLPHFTPRQRRREAESVHENGGVALLEAAAACSNGELRVEVRICSAPDDCGHGPL